MPRGAEAMAGVAGVIAFGATLALADLSSAAQSRGSAGGGGPLVEYPSAPTPGPTPTRIEFTQAIDCYPIAHPDSQTTIGSVDDLVAEYNDGRQWSQLQADLKAILSTCRAAAPGDQISAADFRSRTFLITFVSSAHQPYYVVVPQEQPYSMTLLGVRSVEAVILIDSTITGGKLPVGFMFMSTRIQNPLEARIPAVVKQVPATFVTHTPDSPVRRVEAPAIGTAITPTMSAYVASGISLPFRRASIYEAGTIVLRDAAGDALSEVSIATTYANAPKVRIEFTAVAGAVVGQLHGPQAMKVDAGRYASDPLARALTMATVTWHPTAYDSSLSEMSRAERWSILVGGVLTPAAGAGVGVSLGLIRGFAINAGLVGLWVPSAPRGFTVGSEVTTDSDGRQLQNRFTTGFFTGGSYVFRHQTW